MSAESTVYVVDDDEALRGSLTWLLESVGLHVETFPDAQSFLDAFDPELPGCVVVDIRMPGLSGLDLQRQLNKSKVLLPVIVISGHADVPTAVRAVKEGALDLIEKPFSDELLLQRIREGLGRNRELRESKARREEVSERFACLTPREKEVMNEIVQGHPNKAVAASLGISKKTVEVHRGRIMHKMEARSFAELVRASVLLSDHEPGEEVATRGAGRTRSER